MRDILKESLSDAPGEKEAKPSSCALKSKAKCPRCHGLGVIMNSQSALAGAELCVCLASCKQCGGRAREIKGATSVPCTTPSPVRIKNILNSAHIPAKYAPASFETFDNFTGNGRDIAAQLAQWARRFNPRKSQGLLLTGPVGVGKTYLLACITKTLARRGMSVRFVDFFHLLSLLKSAYSGDASEAEIMAPLLEVDVLIIDELGKGRNSDWELTVIDGLISQRYDANKAVVAATNYKIDLQSRSNNVYAIDLENEGGKSSFDANRFEWLEPRIGKRTYSRLVEMSRIVSMDGKDYRRILAIRHEQMPSDV